jgi:membrane fusion protein, multidrug efflux system
MTRKLLNKSSCFNTNFRTAAFSIVMVTFAVGNAQSADVGKQHSGSLNARGLIRPLQQAFIAVDTPLRVTKILVREAQTFNKGDTILIFDCERLEAEAEAAEAVFREMALTLESNTYLQKRGAIGRNDVEISHARFDRAVAEVKSLKARLRDCRFIAPFSGRVSELTINAYETPQSGKPFLGLVDETNFEIDLIVPSKWLRTLAVGARFSFEVDETRRIYAARIMRTGAVVDPVSQTVKVIAGFEQADDRVQSGMSGTAVFDDRGNER